MVTTIIPLQSLATFRLVNWEEPDPDPSPAGRPGGDRDNIHAQQHGRPLTMNKLAGEAETDYLKRTATLRSDFRSFAGQVRAVALRVGLDRLRPFERCREQVADMLAMCGEGSWATMEPGVHTAPKQCRN